MLEVNCKKCLYFLKTQHYRDKVVYTGEMLTGKILMFIDENYRCKFNRFEIQKNFKLNKKVVCKYYINKIKYMDEYKKKLK